MANKLKSLKEQRKQLLGLARKQRKANKIKSLAKKREDDLKKEIKKLKAETSRSIVSKIARAATPERKRSLKKGFASFQNFATKVSKRLDGI